MTTQKHSISPVFAPRLQPASKKSMSAGGQAPASAPFPSESLLTEAARVAMERGDIPDLSQVCQDLHQAVMAQTGPATVIPFIPILKNVRELHIEEVERHFRQEPAGLNLVLNDKMRISLIYWQPGQTIDIHGHAKGGCVLKVLRGKLLEKRYSPESSPRLLAISTYHRGSLAYIDDDMAWHAVENPYQKPALSLHAYTPGK